MQGEYGVAPRAVLVGGSATHDSALKTLREINASAPASSSASATTWTSAEADAEEQVAGRMLLLRHTHLGDSIQNIRSRCSGKFERAVYTDAFVLIMTYCGLGRALTGIQEIAKFILVAAKDA